MDELLKKLGIEIEYRTLHRHITIVGSFWLLNVVVESAIFIMMLTQYSVTPLEVFITFVYYYITNAQSVVLYDYNTAI